MSPRRFTLGLLATLAAGAFAVTLRASALSRAHEAVASEVTALKQTAADLREWTELKGQREVVAKAKRPTRDVIAQVNGVLRDAGIPTDRLKSLEPEADLPLTGRYRTQTIRLSLERLPLRDIGSFLATWRSAKTVWTPRSIELTQVAAADGASVGFDAHIVIAATYLSDTTQEPPR